MSGIDSGGRPARGRERAWHHALRDVLVHEDRHYILATSSLASAQKRVLKHGETFAVFDRYGDVKPVFLAEEGLYHEGTRYLSSWILRVGQERPLYLSSTVDDDNLGFVADLTNPDVLEEDRLTIPKGTLHLMRTRFLFEACAYERWVLRNYGSVRVRLAVSLHFDADFADIFEVRGSRRPRRGTRLETEVTADGVVLGYAGLDREVRRTAIGFDPPPSDLGPTHADFEVEIGPRETFALELTVRCLRGAEPQRRPRSRALELAAAEQGSLRADACALSSSNEQLNDWLGRSLADLRMMVTHTPQGAYPYAGIPWYSTAFGRDGLWTALECLWLWPDLARGVLGYLAARQAAELRPDQDAEPGKILHETRRGEMAALGEVPFGLYYGSVDSTPLFVLLTGEYFRRSGDLDFAARIWPSVLAALDWIDRWGDGNGDGFVDYQRRSGDGLAQQGWKDSHDSVFHEDGSDPEPPIALCEVQGYVYAARRSIAEVAAALGAAEEAVRQRQLAEALRRRFEEAFWCEDLGTYALALDGGGRRCRVRTSNAGHCLHAGIADPERAARTAATLLAEPSFSGWGIRTVAEGEARYNPMSYHNGSVWPHDNAIVAAGLAGYGLKREAGRVFGAIFDVGLCVDLHRLPELICGFDRRPGSSPTLYPVACAPQAWAAGAIFLLLQACLGLSIDAPRREVRFHRPQLPEFLQGLRIEGLQVGSARLDLQLTRHPNAVGINILRREGAVDVVSVK